MAAIDESPAARRSKTYNGGKSRVTLNVVYMPKVREVNDINTFGFWLTVWLR